MQPAGPDTIRILVATDNHVGYNERDPIRGDDSWKTFDEIMGLARKHDVDMVLLAGDLFHENKPSRKAMYNVMRSLRMNCYGPKPCELEILSDETESFGGVFNHVNYEDPNINVAMPVFSIHGNHDDPSGEGHLAALDLLQVSGLVNYYGRTPESDNILVKPVLLQKGRTKLALYGMSNVRDERLFRTFRDGKVKFFRPGMQKDNWFNLMSVHQNHHAYTETGYLPENFLPEFMDLVIWGHEHECLIEPRLNPEMNFRVMQPGSSIATSLMPGEAVDKHVAILNITGKDFTSRSVRLKTVRPFIMREIVLQDEPGMKAIAKQEDNRSKITRYLTNIVNELIEEAKTKWLEAQEEARTMLPEDQEDSDIEFEAEIPLPLIRLRVEYTAPEGGRFDCENPQRFSNRFINKVANTNDIVQFHRKKTGASRQAKTEAEMPDESVLAQLTIDTVKVEKLVREFLTAQSLTIFPQNSFGDAVGQFVDKDDKHAMEVFVSESLTEQIKHLLKFDGMDEEKIAHAMDEHRSKLEELWAAGHYKNAQRAKIKPKPAHWDSDIDGHWADQPGAVVISGDEVEEEDDVATPESVPAKTSTRRGRGGKASTTTRVSGATSQKGKSASNKTTTVRATTRKKSSKVVDDGDDDDDVIMIDDEAEEEEFPPRKSTRAAAKTPAAPAGSTTTRPTGRQTKLNFSQSQSVAQTRSAPSRARVTHELSDDEISDDDDAFEPMPSTVGSRSRH